MEWEAGKQSSVILLKNSTAIKLIEAGKKTENYSPNDPFLSEANYLLTDEVEVTLRSHEHLEQGQTPQHGR